MLPIVCTMAPCCKKYVRYTSSPSRRKTFRPNHSSVPKSPEKRSVRIVYHGMCVQPIRSA